METDFPKYTYTGPGGSVDIADNLRYIFGTEIGALIPSEELDRIQEGGLCDRVSKARGRWHSMEIHFAIDEALRVAYETKFMPIDEVKAKGFRNSVRIITGVKRIEKETRQREGGIQIEIESIKS